MTYFERPLLNHREIYRQPQEQPAKQIPMALPTDEHRKNQRGFTLIEIMITIGIMAIVTALAVPSFQAWSEETRSASALSKLQSSLTLARMEAIKRGSWVRLCGSSDGESCSGGINNGWLIYHDVDASSSLEEGETIIVNESVNLDDLSVALTDDTGTALQTIGFDYRGFTSQVTRFSATSGERNFKFGLSKIGRIYKL